MDDSVGGGGDGETSTGGGDVDGGGDDSNGGGGGSCNDGGGADGGGGESGDSSGAGEDMVGIILAKQYYRRSFPDKSHPSSKRYEPRYSNEKDALRKLISSQMIFEEQNLTLRMIK